jgi:hypothetical protein
MRLHQYLQEARRNPEQNPKIDIISALEPYKNKKGYFVHFTNVDKLGFNPRTTHNTPQGVYAYPLKEMWKNIVKDKIPYMGRANYVFLFKFNGRYLNVSEYSKSDFDDDIEKLRKLGYENKIKDGFDNWLIGSAKISAYKPDIPASVFMNFTRILSFTITENAGRFISIWTKILRDLGYDAILDLKGKGVIHGCEPKQAVFFDPKTIKVIEMFDNKRIDNTSIIKNFKEFEEISKVLRISELFELVKEGKIDSYTIRKVIILAKNLHTNDKVISTLLLKSTEESMMAFINVSRSYMDYLQGKDDLLEKIINGLLLTGKLNLTGKSKKLTDIIRDLLPLFKSDSKRNYFEEMIK